MAAAQMAPSPTRDAAFGLAALGSAPLAPVAQVPLSAESICDIATVSVLIDDYFTYIHPLIPIPHEPTFRQQFDGRHDITDRSFLALLAAMIECLVTSFPRRVKQIFTTPQARATFPHASMLISRCHAVFTKARGEGFLDREELDLYDACGSYLVGLSFAYMFDLRRWRLYCSEAIIVLRTLNYQKAEDPVDLGIHGGVDYVEQQIGRRLFWLCFVGAMTMRQLGSSDSDVILPNAHSDALPPMPEEVDDDYIRPDHIGAQPPNIVSKIVGFNYNIKIYRAFHHLIAIEMAVGSDTLFDWDRQRTAIRSALREVKAITNDVPVELRLEKREEFGEWPPRQSDVSQYAHPLNSRRNVASDQLGLLPANEPARTSPYSKQTVQFEVQKANIYGTQLATRSYLVERFWNLYEIHERLRASMPSPQAQFSDGKLYSHLSPTVSFLATGLENRFQPPRSAPTPSESHGVDEGEQQMAVEREDIVRDMARLLKTINQVNMEPNGHSFVGCSLNATNEANSKQCHKIRQVASTLLGQDRNLMSRMPTLDAIEVQEYLRGFIDILTKLERIGTSLTKGGDPEFPTSNGNEYSQGTQMPQGQTPLAGINAYGGKTQEEIEEEELIQWASLRDHQERFVMKHEGYLAL